MSESTGEVLWRIDQALRKLFEVEHPFPDYRVMVLERDGRRYRLTFEVDDTPVDTHAKA